MMMKKKDDGRGVSRVLGRGGKCYVRDGWVGVENDD